ncbi:hypothetical protein D9981_01570 [Pseudoalteromonas phenolica O-BC30]|nr:hypothetical protein D9981_01570 [Pseudoalteromonas phenolica O-BC30]
MSKDEFDLLDARLYEMHLDMHGFNYSIDSKSTGAIVFDVRKNGNSLQLLNSYNFISKVKIEYNMKLKQHSITYSFPSSSTESTIIVSDKVWDSIPENQDTRIELVELNSDKAHGLYLFVNCQFEKIYMNLALTTN